MVWHYHIIQPHIQQLDLHPPICFGDIVMDILNYMLDIRISFYISSICHSVIYLIFLDSKTPFSNYKTFSSFMELNLLTKTRGHRSIHIEHQFDHDQAFGTSTSPNLVSCVCLSAWQAPSAESSTYRIIVNSLFPTPSKNT